MFKKLYDFIWHIIYRVGATKVTEAAAAIAYYAILSFFPLILLLIALNSAFIQSVEAQTQILQWANDYLPGSQQIVMANIQHLIKASETVGYVGTIILLWSATLVFAGFAQNINMAWPAANSRHFLVDRLIGLLTISVVIIFLIIVLVTTAIIDAVPRLFPGFFTTFVVRANRFQHIIVQFMPVLTIFALLILFYKYIPNCKVFWREAIVASSFSGVAMLITKSAFVWYITQGPNSYSLVYGSLGTVVAFMLWIYLSSCIILIGGHISAAYAKFFRSPEEHAKAKDFDSEDLPDFPEE